MGSEYERVAGGDGDDDDDDDDDSEQLGCCDIAIPIRSAWTSSVAIAPPVDFLQSKTFATFEGVVKTFINCFEQGRPAILSFNVLLC